MKKIFLLAALALLNASSSALAISYSVSTVNGYGPHQAGVGGEFTLRTSDDFMNSLAEGYGNPAKNQVLGSTTFQTFCVEGNEHIYANTTYDVRLSDRTTSGVLLTKGAAYLYSQFAQGSLTGYNYGAGRSTTAGQLQNTFWAVMGNQVSQTFNPANPFQSLLVTQFGDWTMANQAADAGDYGVYVLNMWASGHVDESAYGRQDQLVWLAKGAGSSVPDAGNSLLLLAFSAGALLLISRQSSIALLAKRMVKIKAQRR